MKLKHSKKVYPVYRNKLVSKYFVSLDRPKYDAKQYSLH